MTGTASGAGRVFMDFESYKNQEWLRRRKLRLEQVRKQSNEIAKALRQKVIDREKERVDVYERISEANLRDWKAEKLAELEWKLRSALEDFGESHRQAEEESELEEMVIKKNKINFAKAKKRGEIAKQEELKKKKMAEERKMSPISRKQITRKKEDLRSALVSSVPFKKQLLDKKKVCDKKSYYKKVPMKKLSKKKYTPCKSCLYKCKLPLESFYCECPETVWINLNEIETCQTSDSESQVRFSKSSISNEKNQKEKPEGTVEFYDFLSRYHGKSFKEFPHLVERITSESNVPNANELAELEEKNKKKDIKKKMEIDALTQERGMEALKREKIQRDYNLLIAKLEELNKKEKILKAQQQNAPRFFHMNDERLSERARTKQRMMNAKFESIYFEAAAQIPQSELPRPDNTLIGGGGDYIQSDDGHSIRLSFSSSDIKRNNSFMPHRESSLSTSCDEASSKSRKIKKNNQLLLDIDRTLKEGRELRKTAPKNRELKAFEKDKEAESKNSSSDLEELKTRNIDPSQNKCEKKTKSQESQTDDIKNFEERKEKNWDGFDRAGDESLPVSSSTSYKSPPSVIRSHRFCQFLASLKGVCEGDVKSQAILKSSGSKKEVNKIFYDLLEKHNVIKLDKNLNLPFESPTLKYYIEKLLNMSRECIANLSVSSENISTPNITDLDVKDEKASDLEYSCTVSSQEEDIIKKINFNRPNHLQEAIKNWKKILGKNSVNVLADLENVQGSPQSRRIGDEAEEYKKATESVSVTYSQNVKRRYDEITKKCSERILELSDMLDKVRRDKEKLLSSASGGSSLSLNKNERTPEKESGEGKEEEEVRAHTKTHPSHSQKPPQICENFFNRYNFSRPSEKTVSSTAVVDSNLFVAPEESLDSWPDVMDELLKKDILTSPFKWSDGENSSEFTKITDDPIKPSSIETVIGNFRKEIRKIKPFSFTVSYPHCDSQVHLRHSSDGGHHESFYNQEKSLSQGSITDWGSCFQKESSLESINHALTSLGLTWAKSFLRKNEESRAMSSSSNSEEKSSGNEEDDFL